MGPSPCYVKLIIATKLSIIVGRVSDSVTRHLAGQRSGYAIANPTYVD